jgi:integrase
MSVSTKVYVEAHRARFRAVWRDAEGRKQREAFATREDAELFQALCRLNPLEQVLAMVRGQSGGDDLTWPPPQPSEPPAASPPCVEAAAPAAAGGGVRFRPYALDYVRQMTGVQDRTRQDTLSTLHNHVFPYFATDDLTLTQIRQKERTDRPGHLLGPDGELLSVSNWLLWLGRRKGFNNVGEQTGPILKAKTIHNLHALLSAILQAAVDDDDQLLDRNPCARSKLPEIQREEQVYLEHHEFQALLQAMPAFFRCLLVFLVGTGVRWGEAAGLSVKHVHLDPPTGQPYVEVLVAWRRVLGGRFALGRVKSRCSQRTITLSPLVVQMLRAQVAGKQPEDAVFTMQQGGRLHHSNFTRVLKKAVLKAGLPEHTRCHSLRHTHVAWLIGADRTIPMLAISRRLGHSSEAFTSKRYGHILARVGTEILVAIDAALDPSGSATLPTGPQVPADVSAGLISVPRWDEATGEQEGRVIDLDAVDAALPEIEIADEDDLAA